MKEITIIPVLQTFAAGILPYSATLMAFSATAHQLKTLGVKMNLQYAPFCQEVYSPRCLLFTQNAGQQNWLQALCNAGMALELSLLYLLDLGSADLPVVFRWVSDIQTFCSAAVSLSAGTTTAAATPCSILAPGKTNYSPRKAIINFLLTYISKDLFQFLQEGGAVLSSGCL